MRRAGPGGARVLHVNFSPPSTRTPEPRNKEPRARNQELPPMTTILGINAYHGDASASLVIDGQLIAAVEEERFNRIKH